MTADPRTGPQRKADTIAKLEAADGDAWVSTASPAGIAHLVPLSYAWDGEFVVLAAEARSVTIRNVRSGGRARLGFGPTRDVVMIDVELDRVLGVDEEAAEATGRRYADQTDWDPRGLADYVFVLLRPRRVQAWRESNELPGRLLMRDGEWLF